MSEDMKQAPMRCRMAGSLVILTLGALVGQTVATLLIVHFIR